jgi:hypothetical protein
LDALHHRPRRALGHVRIQPVRPSSSHTSPEPKPAA